MSDYPRGTFNALSRGINTSCLTLTQVETWKEESTKEKPKTRRIDRRKTPNKSAVAAQVKLVEKVAVSIRLNRNMKNFAKANDPGTKLINWCVKITGGLNN